MGRGQRGEWQRHKLAKMAACSMFLNSARHWGNAVLTQGGRVILQDVAREELISLQYVLVE